MASIPLLANSPAIDKGNIKACPETDQIDKFRSPPCDIGAIEFFPNVSNLVTLVNVGSRFAPAPTPDSPAGTFVISATFRNDRAIPVIVDPFFEVVELSGENLLLNADGGAGRVGATLTPDVKVLEKGASLDVIFLIGLQTTQSFRFFVNMFGVVPGQ
jgi:hypothetical protein